MIGVLSPGLGSLGAHLVAAAVRRAGYHAEVLGDEQMLWPVTAVYLSLMCVRQLRLVPAALRQLGLKPRAADRAERDPLVVLGGQYTAQPAALEPLVDLVCLGDGEITGVEIARRVALRQSKAQIGEELAGLPGFALPGRPLSPAWAPSFETIAIRNGYKHTSTTVEIARGCRRRCLFCSVGWGGGPYREALAEDVREAAQRQHRGQICYFAPDLNGVSWYPGSEIARRNTARDGAEWIGLDGTSERLRAAIGKRRSDAWCRSWITSQTAGRRPKIYCVIGLPGETAADRAEMAGLIRHANTKASESIDFSLVPLQALPHTPFEMIDAHYQAEATDWARQMRAELMDKSSLAFVYGIKGHESHEHDQCLLRAGRWGAEYLLEARTSDSFVSSGKWREVMGRHADLDQLLGPDCDRTWNHVRLTDPARLAAVRRCYERKIS